MRFTYSRKCVAKSPERLHMKWAGKRCSTCAYRAGTVASGDSDDLGLTRVRRALLDTAEAFYCHETGPIKGRTKLCVGHVDAMTKRTLSGYYDRHPPDSPELRTELVAAIGTREKAFKEALASELTPGFEFREAK